MLYKELAVLIESNKVKTGDTLWVVDYRHDDILNKPIRNVAPTKVILFHNDDLPPRKTVYYADYHFRPVGKTGNPLATIIAPYDNTGYRGYTGVSANIFFTEAEAKACYVNQCEKVRQQAEEAAEQAAKRFDLIVRDMNKQIAANR